MPANPNPQTAELLACPRCGNAAFVCITNEVWCRTDRCLRLPRRETKAEAIAVWNTRLAATPAALPSAEDALREAIALLKGLELTEDGYSLRTPYDGDADDEGRSIVVGGEIVATFTDSDEGEQVRDAILALQSPRASDEAVGPVERALLLDADTDLAPFKSGDPGKHVQTLLPTPEWKALAKAAGRRGASLSLMVRIAIRQHLAWLTAYRSPAEIEPASDEVLGEAGYTVSGQVYEAAVAGRQDFRQAYREALAQLKALENAFVPTEEEQAAIVAMSADLSLSHAAVVRQALRHYQLSHTRLKAGETVQWSGDAQRARDFAGPLSASPVPVDASGALIERIEAEARRYAGHYSQGSDGRNTFVMFADWVATLSHTAPVADAQAKEGE